MRRTSLTYRDWARHHRADPASPFVEYRCDKCTRRNTGQIDCEPRNWFRIPDVYDPAQSMDSEPRRIHGLVCAECGNDWERANRNHLVELGPNLILTERVHEALERRANNQVPRPPELVASDRLRAAAGWMTVALAALGVVFGKHQHDQGVWSEGLALFFFIAIAWAAYYLFFSVITPFLDRQDAPIRLEHVAAVSARVVVLAKTRRDEIAEREAFYVSSEWRQLRAAVIREHGMRCGSCGQTITNALDLTVDHVRPRSKHPHLSLVRGNLQVLCRGCNSRKGAKDLAAGPS
jgi:5-methylcytosine-specific restriction endonuclease McrA